MQLFVAIIGAVAVLGFIIYAVLTNNKSIASLSQLGDLQRRSDVNDEIKQERKRRTSVDKNDHTPVVDVPKVSVNERVSFVIGVINACLTSFLIGSCPTKFYLWYSPKAVILIALRYIDFRKKSTHWLLADFCYSANALVLLYIWVFPRSAELFQIMFMCANGPLAWSVLTFNQSLVFHKWQQVVSVFIHVSPMLLSWGLRWYPDPDFVICADPMACGSVSMGSLLWNTMTRFYLWWVVIYYLVVFLLLGNYLESRSFKTLFDRVAGTQMKFLFGKDKMFGASHKLVQRAVYMSTHVLFSLFTMLVACIWWSFWWAHMAFILVICTASVYNSSLHYGAQFLFDRDFKGK